MAAVAKLEPLMVDAKSAGELIGLSRSTWDRMTSAGKTPRPVRLSGGTVRWRYSELNAWTVAGCPERKEWEQMKSKAESN